MHPFNFKRFFINRRQGTTGPADAPQADPFFGKMPTLGRIEGPHLQGLKLYIKHVHLHRKEPVLQCHFYMKSYSLMSWSPFLLEHLSNHHFLWIKSQKSHLLTPMCCCHSSLPFGRPFRCFTKALWVFSHVFSGIVFEEHEILPRLLAVSHDVHQHPGMGCLSLDWFCWENLKRKPMGFYHQILRAFRLEFSHHPILWFLSPGLSPLLSYPIMKSYEYKLVINIIFHDEIFLSWFHDGDMILIPIVIRFTRGFDGDMMVFFDHH